MGYDINKAGWASSIEEATSRCEAPVMEPKLDGWRITAEITETGCVIRSGFGREIRVLPEIEARLMTMFKPGVILDGEAIDRRSGGRDRVGWGTVQSVLSRHAPCPEREHIAFVVFDVLAIDNAGVGHTGIDVRGLPLQGRRSWLEGMFELKPPSTDNVQLIPRLTAHQAILDALVDDGFEGAIVKDEMSSYRSGSRGVGVFKLKVQLDEDVTVTGFTDGNGTFKGMVGAIKFVTSEGVDGQCSGMTLAVRQDMSDDPERYLGKVIEIAHNGRMPGGVLRSPQFRRLRPDKG